MELFYSPHALWRIERRGIPKSDIVAVVAYPSKVARAKRGRVNYFGDGPQCGFRIRVTIARMRYVVTVTWADFRKGVSP